MPKPPGSEVQIRPRAPHSPQRSGVPPDRVLTGEMICTAIICHLTITLSHGNMLLRYCPKGKCYGPTPETSPANDDGPV